MTIMKAVGLNRMGELEEELKHNFPNITFNFYADARDITDEDKEELQILFGHDSHVDEAFLKSCPNLKWIAWYATGVNKLPLTYIAENNILLTNGRGIQAKQLSEFIMTFILDDYKKMRLSYENQRQHIYDPKIVAERVTNNTILFLGTGSIAQRTARLAKAFGMKIIGISKSGTMKDNFDETYQIDQLKEVVPKADIIVNALPETEETIHLLTKEHFELMSDDALFINIGRGTIVKEEIILEVLKEHIIRYAYLDVFENEPLEADHPLYDLDNVTITAHITGNDSQAKIDLTHIFEKNLTSFLNKGELVENVVDATQGY